MHPDFGGGSLTALPIIETQLGDITTYIPTNVISITDGQLFLEGDLFYAGIRPAINVGLSVSRVGGKAQTKAMKDVAGKLRLELAQFRELAAFAQFGSDLDKATRDQLERGQRLTEVLKQPQYEPVPLDHQVMLIYAVTHDYADDVAIDEMRDWADGILRFMDSVHPEIGGRIMETEQLDEETENKLREMILEYKESVS
jgi:F-type H+-transporting ATPase subunit alpha